MKLIESDRFSKQASKIASYKILTADEKSERDRVFSGIADVLKDAHVQYAKLARLQGDFAGKELDDLQQISEAILSVGRKLSDFAKAFYEGDYKMQPAEIIYGGGSGGQAPVKETFEVEDAFSHPGGKSPEAEEAPEAEEEEEED